MIQECQSNLKGTVSIYEKKLFFWHDTTGNLMGILAMHVDDFIFCGNNTFQRNVISELKRIFKHMKMEPSNFLDWVFSK